MIDQFIMYVLPLLLITYMTLWTYMLINDYKRKQARAKEALLDTIPCLCGHSRWIHWVKPNTNTANARCQDFVWDTMCKCTNYRMDNLAYLEKVSENA